MSKHSKRFNNLKEQIDQKKIYSLVDAIKLAIDTSKTKFDASIDIALKLNLDTTKADQQFRGTITLPHYFGKNIKILVIADNISAEEAKSCGIDFMGTTDKINEIKAGWMDFDLIITTPKFMPELSKFGKILGPKGLMPNPKLGTVTQDVIKTVKDFKKGKSNYRTDTYGNIHLKVGKASATEKQIAENINTFLDFIRSKRPSTVKGEYIQNISISSTMGPSIKIDKNLFI